MKYTQEVILEKLKKYCAYQDRCHQEVRHKILSYEVYGDDLEEIINELISEKFLNEERYAKSYARGKFRIKRWGRRKIIQELKKRQISEYCIKKGMAEIDETEYMEALRELILRKVDQSSGSNNLIKRDKAIKYAISRGYEQPLIYQVIKEMEIGE